MRRLIVFAFHPLGVLWLLAGVALVGGLGEWVFLNRSPWEGIGAAAVIAGVIQIVARVTGVSAWPWQMSEDVAETTGPEESESSRLVHEWKGRKAKR